MPRDRHTPTPPSPTSLRAAICAIAALWSALVMGAVPPYAGRRLDEVLRELGAGGLKLIYSSETVPPGLRVSVEPAGATPSDVLQALLAEHGLRAQRVGRNTYAIVRATQAPAAGTDAAAAAAPPPLERIVVTASRYSLAADVPDIHTLLTQDEIEGLPRLAEDSLKAVHRLPGAASNGLSGLASIRGGEDNESLVVFDGLPLYEPFHLRLLLSPASVLDPRVLAGLDVHAGGYTAEFGDRMSAVIEARSLRPEPDRYHELGLSLFHAHALASRRFGDGQGQWLAAVRRSNLDEIADIAQSDLGEPSYLDGFARVDYAFSAATRGSLHALLASDRLEVRNSDETEFADADYRNSYVWAALEHDFSPRFGGRAILSYTDVASHRTGAVEETGRRSGSVDDERHYDVLGLKLDGHYSTDRWLHRFGLEFRGLAADYDYASSVRFEPGFPFPDSAAMQFERALDLRPSGEHVAVYATSRVLVTDRLAAEIGLRWDEQSYSADADDQLGPRMNLAYELGASTRLRASWGRYQQFQGINELQVEDGIDSYFPAQQADHSIVGVEQDLPAGYALRIEAYRKDYRQLKPRYESLFDPLSLVPELRWDRVRIEPQSSLAEGVELLLTRRSADPWNGWLNYSWSRVRDRIDGLDVPRSWDQTHAVGFGLTWTDGGWQATLAGAWHTGWPTTPVNGLEIGERNSARYEDYASVDLRVSRDFTLPRGELTVFGEITNALDRRNPCCTDYTYELAEGGGVALERDYRHRLPLVPSLGVLWKF